MVEKAMSQLRMLKTLDESDSKSELPPLKKMAEEMGADFYECQGKKLRYVGSLPYLYKFRARCREVAEEKKWTNEEILEFQKYAFDKLVDDKIIIPSSRNSVKRRVTYLNFFTNLKQASLSSMAQEVQQIYHEIIGLMDKLKNYQEKLHGTPVGKIASLLYELAQEEFEVMFDQARNDQERFEQATLLKNKIVEYVEALQSCHPANFSSGLLDKKI